MDPIVFDIESRGLDPCLPGFEILMLGVKSGNGPSRLAVGDAIPKAARWLAEQEATGHPLVAWNAGFDALVLRHLYGVRLHPHDPMFLAYLLDENERHDLKSVAVRRLGVDPWEHGVRSEIASGREIEEARLAEYCGRDCLYTMLLYRQLLEAVQADPQLAEVYHHILLPALWMFLDAQYRGTYIDHTQIIKAARVARKEVRKAKKEIVAEGLAHNLVVNPNAPHQVAKLLYDTLHLPVTEWTEKGQPSTGKLALKRIKEHHPVVRSLLAYRVWSKRFTTYIEPYWDLAKAYPGQRIHPQFHLTFTVTGRTSSSGPNIQQVPRDPLIRGFVSAAPGKKLVIADYAQIELRTTAEIAPEPNMLAAFQQGLDLHAIMAQEVMGDRYDPTDKEQRSRAKPVNFGFVFGADEQTYQNYCLKEYDLVISDEDAAKHREAFFRRWNKMEDYYRRIYQEVKATGLVRSPTGRIRHLPDIASPVHSVRTEALRQAINFPIQSFASDLLLLAAVEIDDLVPNSLIACVHDSVILEVSWKDAGWVADLAKDRMELGVPALVKRIFGLTLTVPLVADVTVLDRWA